MKKIILALFIAICVLGISNLNAQNIKYGVRAGLNSSTFNEKGDSDAGVKFGYYIGGFAEIKLNTNFAVQPELQYASYGAEYNNGDSNMNLNYLVLPIVFKYYATEKFNIQLGPKLAYNLVAEAEQGSITIDLKANDDFFDLNDFDYGFVFGFGYDFNEKFALDTRFDYSFREIYKDSESYNMAFQFGISYKF